MTREPACSYGERRGDAERGKIPSDVEVVVEMKDAAEQHACETVRKDQPDNRCNQTEHGELDREDAGNTRARRAECLQHDNLADAAITRACDCARENHDSGKGAEAGQKLDYVADLQQHLPHRFYRGGNIDHGDRWIVLIEDAAKLACCRGITMQPAIPCDREPPQRGLWEDELRA